MSGRILSNASGYSTTFDPSRRCQQLVMIDPPDDIPDELWGVVGNGYIVAAYQFRKDAEELKAHLPKSEIEFKVIRYVPDNDD